MDVQVCGVKDIAAAKSLARNSFPNNFSRHLKVTRKDITEDTFKTMEKRSENDIAAEPHTKTDVLAFHCWVKTCHWSDIDPEQMPLPHVNADEILKKVDEHKQFTSDATDIKTTAKPDLFAKDDKWDN